MGHSNLAIVRPLVDMCIGCTGVRVYKCQCKCNSGHIHSGWEKMREKNVKLYVAARGRDLSAAEEKNSG